MKNLPLLKRTTTCEEIIRVEMKQHNLNTHNSYLYQNSSYKIIPTNALMYSVTAFVQYFFTILHTVD